MTALSNQMQEKMTLCLNQLRQEVITKMQGAGERIKQRPAVKGDDSLRQVSGHPVMQDDGMGDLLTTALSPVPGLSDIVEAGIDIATTTYDEMNAGKRPQDEVELSPRQEAQIRVANEIDVRQFHSLQVKLFELEGALASGCVYGMLCEESGDMKFIDVDCKVDMHKPEDRTHQPTLAFIAQMTRPLGMHV